MKKNKWVLISVATLLGIAPAIEIANNGHTVQAATNKAVMHTAIAYDKDGNKTGKKYYSYQYVTVESNPVKIDGSLYYKISGKDQYLKATNIDGVTRKITHNTYIYKSSNGRTYYGNHRWKLYKGETVTTYGGSYKFKNGKHYFRVAGPRKQYIKSANLGPVVRVNTVMGPDSNASNPVTNKPTNSTNTKPTSNEETTVTVDANYSTPIITFDNSGKVVKVRTATPGEKFTVDYKETGYRANKVAGYIGQFGGDQAIYRIKGTNNWLYSMGVKVAKDIPSHYYDYEHFSIIQFIKETDAYNEDGTKIDLKGQKIRKQSGQYKVDKLLYIWVPTEQKAELFYHLVTKRLDADHNYFTVKDAYVKASDVEFHGVKLTPSNTPEEAQAAALKK